MDPRAATVLKWAIFCIIAIFAFGYGSKHYKKHARKEALVAEMRTAVSEASFYRSITQESARSVLLSSIAKIEEAKTLGLEPTAYFDQVFKRDSGKKTGGDEFVDYPAREKLARETLLRAHQHAVDLGLLATLENRKAMAAGEMPEVEAKPVIVCIIDTTISPGIEKILPNLELRPGGVKTGPPTDLEIAAGKNLAEDLYGAQIIDKDAEMRISKHFRPPASSK
jgi:hypothetical protein